MFGQFQDTIRRLFCKDAQIVEVPILIEPDRVPKHKEYPNWKEHPELQSLGTDAGFRSALMKQLETNEHLLRVLIEIELEGVSSTERRNKLYARLNHD